MRQRASALYPGASWYNVGFLPRSGKYPAVDVLVWENFRQRWYRQILGIRTMQDRHRERVNEHLGINAIATVNGHRKEVFVGAHTYIKDTLKINFVKAHEIF